MSVNKSDSIFFEKAEEIMNQALSHIDGAPTINDIRRTIQYFKPYLSDEALLHYDELLIPSQHSPNTLRARWIAKGDEIKPLVLFFPGTAFIHEMFDENYTVFSRMMKHIDAHGVMLEYRLSPENPFPAPHQDASDALHYLLANKNELKINPNRMIISGHSSGANMAAVLCNSLQDNHDFQPFHQYLLSGGYDYTDSLHDYDNYANEDKMLDKNAQQMSFDLYCQTADRKDPNCSPYWQDDFSNLCPTTIQCGEYDGGRSQSEGYANKLIKHNADVTKIIVPGQSHLAIIYRGACSDGDDPAVIAAKRMNDLIQMQHTEQQAHAVLEKLMVISKQVLGDKFISCYALGSLAHGGFSSQVSDIDFCVILKDPIDASSDADFIDQITEKIKATNLPLVDRVSIFWSSLNELKSPGGYGRMPALDKLDFLLNAKLLSGEDIRTDEIPRPTQHEIDVSGAYFIVDILFGDKFRAFIINPVDTILKSRNTKLLTKIILFPARLLYTLETERMGENELATEYYANKHQHDAARWVKQAYQWRTSKPDFSQIKADELIAAINVLYDQMIEGYAQRMLYYGENILAKKLMALKTSLIKIS